MKNMCIWEHTLERKRRSSISVPERRKLDRIGEKIDEFLHERCIFIAKSRTPTQHGARLYAGA